MDHRTVAPDDDRGPGVDGNHLVALAAIEDEDPPPGTLGLRGRGSSGLATADDRDIGLVMPDRDLDLARLVVPPRRTVRGMALDGQPVTRRGQAGPDVGDALDLGDAVAAVTGQAQGSTSSRMLAGPHHGHRHRVARLVRQVGAVEQESAGVRAHGSEASTGRRRQTVGRVPDRSVQSAVP